MIVGPLLLKSFLPEHYRVHFIKLCSAFNLLLQDSVSAQNIDYADKLLTEFAGAIVGLYGKRFLTFNLHVTLHAPLVVRRWGPLWSYSAFQFEHQNGRLSRLINGTRFVALELAEKLSVEHALNKMASSAFQTNIAADEFFNALLNNRKYFSTALKIQDFVLVGASKPYYFSSNEIQKLQILDVRGVTQAILFKKVIFKSLLFGTHKENNMRFNDSVISIQGQLYLVRGLLAITSSPYNDVIFMLSKLYVSTVKSLKNILKVNSVVEALTLKRTPTTFIDVSKFIIIHELEKQIKFI
ncbi:unnamed protein product, partial [Allacma fusca]